VWIVVCPLKNIFPALFVCCEQQNKTASEVLINGGILITFDISFGTVEVNEWGELQELLGDVQLSEAEDKVKWELEKSGKFSTKSMYLFILNPGILDGRMSEMWKTNCPLKQKNFLWLCFRGQIQSASQLSVRKWIISCFVV
jgi:hypothetical protein